MWMVGELLDEGQPMFLNCRGKHLRRKKRMDAPLNDPLALIRFVGEWWKTGRGRANSLVWRWSVVLDEDLGVKVNSSPSIFEIPSLS